LPDWGIYVRWPTNGDAWIHSDDVAVAKRLIPSPRVWRREAWDGEFYHLRYGQIELRLRPSMWLPVPAIDLEVGQQVELLSRQFRNDPGIFRISDMFYSTARQTVDYFLHGESLRLAKPFSREDLRPLQVQYHLRVGFYQHPNPASDIPADVQLLDVGDLAQ